MLLSVKGRTLRFSPFRVCLHEKIGDSLMSIQKVTLNLCTSYCPVPINQLEHSLRKEDETYILFLYLNAGDYSHREGFSD